MWLEKKPPQFEAHQFVGGLESTMALTKWFRRFGIRVSWTPELGNKGDKDYLDERLWVSVDAGPPVGMEVDEWVVCDPTMLHNQPFNPEAFTFMMSETLERVFLIPKEVVDDAG